MSKPDQKISKRREIQQSRQRVWLQVAVLLAHLLVAMAFLLSGIIDETIVTLWIYFFLFHIMFVIQKSSKEYRLRRDLGAHQVQIPVHKPQVSIPSDKPAYFEAADGQQLEVVDNPDNLTLDDILPDDKKRKNDDPPA